MEGLQGVDLACPACSVSSQCTGSRDRRQQEGLPSVGRDLTGCCHPTATTLLAVLHYAAGLDWEQLRRRMYSPEHQAITGSVAFVARSSPDDSDFMRPNITIFPGISALRPEGEGSRHLRTTPTAYCWRFRRQYTPSTHTLVPLGYGCIGLLFAWNLRGGVQAELVSDRLSEIEV
jgi:hypothetical protein